jgi:carbamoyltransferase
MNNIVMGISIGHNRGAAITINGDLKVAISNERVTRIKTDHSDSLPLESMRYCLEALNLEYKDIDAFIYNTTEDINRAPEEFEIETGMSRDRLNFVPHHLAHAYSTFCASDFDEAAVVVADAMGSVYNDETPIKDWFKVDESGLNPGEHLAEGYSIYHFSRKDQTINQSYCKWVVYPFREGDPEAETSIGHKYGMGSKQLVYNPVHNTWQAGKLMGLASYANKEWVDSHPIQTRFEDEDMYVMVQTFYPEVTWQSNFQQKANVAGLYQREQELSSLHLAKMAKKITNSNNICVAGGSFLNCNTNELIIREGIYDNAYFMPPADDSGIPIGCAYYGSHVLMGKIPTSEGWMTAYLGKTYTEQEINDAIDLYSSSINVIKLEEDEMVDTVANLLNENRVIGWFQKGSEMGPRALGCRSILASPKQAWMPQYINSEIKLREWYRPFAPSVLYEKQAEIFELDTYSPYMLVTTEVKPEWRSKIPAVTHIDGTARYQSVTPDNNPKYHKLISKFNEVSGVPVVLNTSFNGPEEPIVETPTNAINTFLKRNLYALVLNNYLITRK